MAAQCQKDGRKEKTEKARIVLLGFLTPFSFFSSSSFFFLKIKLQEKVKYIYINLNFQRKVEKTKASLVWMIKRYEEFALSLFLGHPLNVLKMSL